MIAHGSAQGPEMSLKQSALRSVKWTSASFLAVYGGQFVQVLILARVLSPAEFGKVTIITLLIGFIEIFLGFGLVQAVIQRRAVSSRQLSSVYWLNAFWSLVLAAVVFFLSHPIALFFNAPSAAPLIQLCSAAFILGGLSQLNLAVLERRLRFRNIAIAEVLAVSVGFATTMALAFSGFGASSAVWGILVTYTTKLVIYRLGARRYFRLRFRFRLHETRPFLQFGLFQTLDTVLNYASANISSIVTGRILGPTVLGGYNMAYSTVVNTPMKINPILTRVMMPIFSRLQHDRDRIAAGFLTTTSLAGFISIPPLVGIALVSESFTEVLFGQRYLWLAPIVPMLCFVGVFRAVGNPVGSLLMSTNNVKLGLTVNILKTSVTLPLVIVATMLWGVYGAAGGLLVTGVIGFFVAYFTVHRVVRIRFVDYAVANFAPLLLSIPMGIGIVAAGLVMPSTWPALVRLGVSAVVGVLLLVATMMMSRSERVLELRGLIQTQLPGRLRSKPVAPLAVLLPAIERFDGTGGAVATWVREVYRRFPAPYSVYSPGVGGAFAEGVSTAPAGLYGVIRRLVLVASRIAGRALGRSPYSLHDRLLGSGKVYLWALWPSLRQTKVIHVHNRPRMALWLRDHGYRGTIVLHLHNELLGFFPPDSPEGRRIADATDRMLFCSEFLRQKGIAEFGLNPADTAVVYNGVDAGELGSARADQPRDQTALVFAGRLVPEKGAAEAVEVCKRLRQRGLDVGLDMFGGAIAGGGKKTDYWAGVETAAREVNELFATDVVRVHGHVSYSMLLDQVARRGVFLYPVRWEEPFGMVIVEALAVGTPVVSYARGGIPEILDDSCGVLLPPDADLDAVVDAVAALIGDPSYPALSRAARDRAAEFSWDRVTGDTFARIREAVGAESERILPAKEHKLH